MKGGDMKAEVNKYADSERSEELTVMVSPKALRPLESRPAEHWGSVAEEDITVLLKLPASAQAKLEAMAAYLDTTPGALMRRYIGQGLRQDLATYFQEQALWAVQDALEKRLDRVAAEVLLAEVRAEFQGPPLRPRVHAAGD